MTEGALTPEEREEYESDLIAFSDRELDLLGDVSGLEVLYAGGTSPLWIEGLAERVGPSGSLAVLDLDVEGLRRAADFFGPGDLPLRPRFVPGDVFDLPFGDDAFDLAYSSGLLHELDVSGRGIPDALAELVRVVRPGGRVATSDFVSDVPAAQLEEEAVEAEVAKLARGVELSSAGSAERLVRAHERALRDVKWRVSPPFQLRHLERLLPSEPAGLDSLGPKDAARLGRRWNSLRECVEIEGYTRPATLFVEGVEAAGL